MPEIAIKEPRYIIPSWIMDALKVVKPPEKLTVSEWAEKYRILDAKTSNEPGRWKNSRTPYLVGVMDAFNDREVEDITFLKSTQIGGTEALNNIICFVVAQDPSPCLVVYPILDLANWVSANRLQPMLKLSSETRKNFLDTQSQKLELQFNGMYLSLAGSNSPSSLASKPVRYVFMDEVDKFEKNAGKEGNPQDLAVERTRTFTHNKKIFRTSTPTTEEGNIQKAFNTADTQYYYYVPCPHCGQYQRLYFQNIRWDKDYKTLDQVRESAYYECEKCKININNNYKQSMLRNGKWIAEKSQGKTKVAFFINCLYSPWLRFGDIAVKFLECKDDPDKLQNFINSWLAESWKDTQVKLDTDIVFERQSEYEEAIIPDDALILTAGVDVQEYSLYYTIRAWGTNLTSWGIAYGEVETFEDIEYIMNLPYSFESGGTMQVEVCCIDTGHRIEEVYDFVSKNMEWAKPVKGSSRELTKRYNISQIDNISSKANGMSLYIVDTGKYKDRIAGRLQRPNGKGSFMVFKGIGNDYAKQITSEEKIKDQKGNLVWRVKPGNPNNHYLDTEVYSCVAADLLQVGYLTDTNTEENFKEREKQLNNIKNINNQWINTKKDWLK